ncbi:MAG: hypothetical protein ACHQ0Y_15135 [Thermodesulfovibrionales bacterium]
MKSVTRMARLPAPDPARKLGITGRMIGYKIIRYGISAEFHAEFGKIKGVELTQPTMPIKRS